MSRRYKKTVVIKLREKGRVPNSDAELPSFATREGPKRVRIKEMRSETFTFVCLGCALHVEKPNVLNFCRELFSTNHFSFASKIQKSWL